MPISQVAAYLAVPLTFSILFVSLTEVLTCTISANQLVAFLIVSRYIYLLFQQFLSFLLLDLCSFDFLGIMISLTPKIWMLSLLVFSLFFSECKVSKVVDYFNIPAYFAFCAIRFVVTLLLILKYFKISFRILKDLTRIILFIFLFFTQLHYSQRK